MFVCGLAGVSFTVKVLQERMVQKVQYCNKWNLKCNLKNSKIYSNKKPGNRELWYMYVTKPEAEQDFNET